MHNIWQKYPHLKPGQKSFVIEASNPNDLQECRAEEEILCVSLQELAPTRRSGSLTPLRTTSHMCYQKDIFIGFEELPPYDIKREITLA